MVEHQSGTLNELEGTKDPVVDIQHEAGTAWKGARKALNLKVEQLAADAHVSLGMPTVIVGDESSVGPQAEELPGLAKEDLSFLEGQTLELGLSARTKMDIQDADNLPDLDTTDWMEELEENEVFNSDKNGALPRLHGLRRLAKPYITSEDSKVNALITVQREFVRNLETRSGNGDVMSVSEVVGTHHVPMASVTFTIRLIDGRIFSDSADAFHYSCKELGLFPTAVASSRAEARCLRKVLNITQHAAEEIVDKDASEELTPDDDQKIGGAQVKMIEKIMKTLTDYELVDLLKEITTREIFSVDEMTTGEARKALKLLHDRKKLQNKNKNNKKKKK